MRGVGMSAMVAIECKYLDTAFKSFDKYVDLPYDDYDDGDGAVDGDDIDGDDIVDDDDNDDVDNHNDESDENEADDNVAVDNDDVDDDNDKIEENEADDEEDDEKYEAWRRWS